MNSTTIFNPRNLLLGSALFASVAAIGQPTLTTLPAASVSHNYAWIGGDINPNGGSYYTGFAFGTTTAYEDTILAYPSPVNGTTTQTVMNTPNPVPATTYYYRIIAQATTGGPIYAGQPMSFTSDSLTRPNILSYGVQHLPGYSFATFTLNFNPNHAETNVSFEYGPTTAYGNSGYVSPNYIDGYGTKSTGVELQGLIPGDVVHYRWKVSNQLGFRYGPDMMLNVGQLKVASFEKGGFSIYPSPASNVLTIKCPAGKDRLELGVTDMAGKQIAVPFAKSTNSFTVDVSRLASGVYHVLLSGDGNTYSASFTKE